LAAAAFALGFRHLGFSSHAPVPFKTVWHMPAGELPAYLADIRRLKREYAGRMDILLGLEVDFLPGVLSPRSPHIMDLGLDYIVGSVHYVTDPVRTGSDWTVDGTLQEVRDGIRSDFGGNARAAVETYYTRLRQMVETAPPDFVGHLDLVKVNNPGKALFDEDSDWYHDAALAALDAITHAGCRIEVSTGGMTRRGLPDLFPSEWLLRAAVERDVPIVINTDAHGPAELDGNLEVALAQLRKLGCRQHHVLTARGWITRPLA
jgi:histidinol-phosphatase (PHP family)